MSISIKKNGFSLAIGDAKSEGFDIMLGGSQYRADDFVLNQQLLMPNSLSFSLHKGPMERSNDPKLTVCGEIIGKKIELLVRTENIESSSFPFLDMIDKTEDIEFHGVITSAQGSRIGTEYNINVEAQSWDALLNDHPNCKSYENMTLHDIVNDVVDDYNEHLDTIIDPRFQEKIPYCVQYNENNYQFLQRLAMRYGEWLYNDGTHLVFGLLQQKDSIRLSYPSSDIPSYNVAMQMEHLDFAQIASSYNSFNAKKKEGLAEMQTSYNSLSDNVFNASQQNYVKKTLQNLHSGGYANSDSKDTILNVAAKTQARGLKAGMLTYTGQTYSSKLRLGTPMVIVDNYITDSIFNKKDPSTQDEILVIGLVHYFSADQSYSNTFTAIPVACDYPPYQNSEAYPKAPSCRAKVTDNEDNDNTAPMGRIRVQFDWQAQQSADMKTPWLRIVQPYAGGDKGFSFIPEVGEEVMVDFEGGNAERPYVKGTLYNGKGSTDSAWLPDHNRRNQIKAIRTRNGHTIEIHDEGNDGYIRIYDNKKENYILTFSTDEKLIKLESTGNIELYAKNSIIMQAGNDIQATAGHDITSSAGHDISETADNDIFNAAAHDIQRTADNDMREHADNDRTTSIGHNDELTVEENQFVKVNENKDEQIAHKLQLTAENIRVEAEEKLLEYSDTHHQKAESKMAINAGDRIDIKAGTVKVN